MRFRRALLLALIAANLALAALMVIQSSFRSPVHWAVGRPPPPCVQGMTLEPGQSCSLSIEIPATPERPEPSSSGTGL